MREEVKAVAGTKSLAYWIVLLGLSFFLVLTVGDSSSAMIWITFLGGLSLISFLYRKHSFSKNSQELLNRGRSMSPYDRRRQHRVLILLMMITVVAFFAPLFLSAALNFSVWFGSLVGIIDGWILGLLSFNLFLLYWESKNYGKLYVVEEWSGSILTERGLAFIKR